MDADRLLKALPQEAHQKYLAAVAGRAAAHAAFLASQDRLVAVIDARDQQLLAIAAAIETYRNSDEIQERRKRIDADGNIKIEHAHIAVAAASKTFRSFYFLDGVERWLSRATGMGLKLTAAPFTGRVNSRHGEAVGKLRAEIEDLTAERERVAETPEPLDHEKARVDRHLSELAREGKPRVDLSVPGRSAIDFHTLAHAVVGPGGADASDGGLRLICWLLHDELRQKLHELIEEAAPSQGMTGEERSAALAKIDAHRLELEREEEAHICAAQAVGTVMERRRDIDPRAFLQVKEA